MGDYQDEKGNKERRDDLRRMLLSYRDYYGNYHNHKENMAWIATVFYVSVVGGSLKLVNDSNNCLLKQSALIIVILFSFLISYFVHQQLKSRYNAACVVRAGSICLVNLSDPNDSRFDIPKILRLVGVVSFLNSYKMKLIPKKIKLKISPLKYLDAQNT